MHPFPPLFSAPRRILVIGPATLGHGVCAAVGTRAAVDVWSGTASAVPASLVAGADELVVERPAADELRRLDPSMMLRIPRVRVVEPDERIDAVVSDPLPLVGRGVKRAIDVVGSAILLVLTLPLLLAAIVAVKLDSKGPAFFVQERMGRDGRRFRLVKLRTMAVDNDDAEHLAYVAAMIRGEAQQQDGVFKLTADPRVTRVGRTLRKLSIDELPQLWNVLRGQMSLVGPRPPMPSEVELYDARAWERLRVKPGLTGLWQVSGRNEISFSEMVDLDVRYWSTWSLATELSILLRTPAAVLSTRRAA
jgi:lipopolysaccharide/colanic/teichoic acid biosynthesis glycosyltransferase